MPEYTVHYDMQIVPHRDLLGAFITPQNVLRIIEQILAIDYNKIAEDMFENKTFYTDNSATLIEKVTVYTAYPDKFISNIQ